MDALTVCEQKHRVPWTLRPTQNDVCSNHLMLQRFIKWTPIFCLILLIILRHTLITTLLKMKNLTLTKFSWHLRVSHCSLWISTLFVEHRLNTTLYQPSNDLKYTHLSLSTPTDKIPLLRWNSADEPGEGIVMGKCLGSHRGNLWVLVTTCRLFTDNQPRSQQKHVFTIITPLRVD